MDTTKLKENQLGRWEYKKFAGIWKETKDPKEGKGIFNDMEVRIADDDTKCEVMCLSFNGFSAYEDGQETGIQDAKYHYYSPEKKWYAFESDTTKENVPALLDVLYGWIKGKWEDLNEMCLSGSSSRNDDASVKEDLINFCYSKGE